MLNKTLLLYNVYSALSYPTSFSYGLPFAVHTRYSLAVEPPLLAAQGPGRLVVLPAGGGGI